MIEIDEKSKKIYFYYSPEEIKKNSKHDDKMYEFELLSAHICPECKRIIEAYYIGKLPIEDSSSEWKCHPYLQFAASYNRYDPHYKYGHAYGGGYLKLCNHDDTLCKLKINSDLEPNFKIEDICSQRIPIQVFKNSIPEEN